MGHRNNTIEPVFILTGLTESEAIWWVLFMLFLLMYVITVPENAGMIMIIHLDLQLHTPMYLFLSHLSFLDRSYSTIITPKTLEDLMNSRQYISFMGGLTQIYIFFIFLGTIECLLLSSMAYDCYGAICNLLHYHVVMSTRLCCTHISGSYVTGFTDSMVNILCMNSLHFCKSNVVHHFFCNTMPMLALSCTDTLVTEIMIFILAGSTLKVSLTTITVFYGSILSTILKINSTSGKQKAFSTCASHLLGVTIFYGNTIFTYLKPKNSYSLGKVQIATMFYSVVIPMLNPLIYSLRNKEMKNALIKVLQKREGSR